jgi:L-2-aminoadipate reductase
MIYAYRGLVLPSGSSMDVLINDLLDRAELVVAYMGALKAGATVSVIDPQYPPERQKVLLDVARPRFLVCIRKATEDSGPLSDLVLEFVSSSLSLKSTVPALALSDSGEVTGGLVDGKDCLDASVYSREDPTNVLIGPDSIPTLSFTSGSEGRPKVESLLHGPVGVTNRLNRVFRAATSL